MDGNTPVCDRIRKKNSLCLSAFSAFPFVCMDPAEGVRDHLQTVANAVALSPSQLLDQDGGDFLVGRQAWHQ